jgi:branched-chain amino acid transport system permease protein
LKRSASAIVVSIWILGACIPIIYNDNFIMHVANLILLGSTLALSWGILALSGSVSFGHNAFIGIGAYTSAYFVMQHGFTFLGGLLAAGIVTAAFAFPLGAIVLRLRGIFFALATFCFAQIMIRIFRIAKPITGGADGIRGIPPPDFFFIGSIDSHAQFYLLFYIYATLVIIFTIRLFDSNMGKEFRAIGEDIFIAESSGINTFKKKNIAFTISAILAGFGGCLHAHYFFFISDTTFETIKALEVVMYNVVGGVGTIIGPIIGAFIMIPLPEFLRGFIAYQIAIYGLVLILILKFFPLGIWGTIRNAYIRRSHQGEAESSKAMQLSAFEFDEEILKGFSPPENGGPIILECAQVSKNFGGITALKEVSFSVKRGEILGVIGPNGAGKSTLLNVITGTMPVTNGSVLFDGKNITNLKANKVNHLGLSRLFQAAILYNEARVQVNIARALAARAGFNIFQDLFGLEKHKHRWVAVQTEQVLRLFGLERIAEEVPKNLPHGFQRLVGMAMAMASKPSLLLLDEPVGGMSVEEREIIETIIKRLNQQGISMIIVEHNVNFVLNLCHRIIVLDYGEKIAEGAPEEVMNNTKVIDAYIGCS